MSSCHRRTVSLPLGLARLVAKEEEPPLPLPGEEPKPDEHHKPSTPLTSPTFFVSTSSSPTCPDPADAREDRGENPHPL
jgi:hypothetical protein